MYGCEDCQRVLKTAQALAGHNQFKHGVKRAAQPEPVFMELLKQRLEQLKHTTDQIEQRVEQLLS